MPDRDLRDLSELFGVSRRDVEFLRKTLPEYQKGKESGLSAQEPPANLNEVTRIKLTGEELLLRTSFLGKRLEKDYQFQPPKEPIPEKVAFRNGYLDGLRSFLAQHEISLRDVGVFNFPDVLTSRAGLNGFVRGLRRESPAVGRDYTTRHRDDEKFLYNREPDCGWLDRFGFELSQTLSGYEPGFFISITRDFGIRLRTLDVPRDDMTYEAFMKGLNTEPKEMPLRRDRLEKEYYLGDNPYEIYESLDNNAYLAGLGVWLASQGLGQIKTWQIRHPEALRTFKTALEGQVLSEYEPREAPVRMSTFGKDFRKLSLENFLEKPYSPSSYEIARREGAQGYLLGKRARSLRVSTQSSTSGS